jgi:hypothetical protein
MANVAVHPESCHIVNILPPIDITGGKTGDRFHMKYHKKALIVVQVGVSAAAFTKIIVNSCDAATGGTATAIPFTLYAEETALGDTLGAREAILAAGRTPSANDGIFYVIPLDADELLDGHDWVELSLTNGANSVIGSAIAILSGARYAADQSATAIA